MEGETKLLQAYILARSMRRAGKRGLTYDEWCLETGRDPADTTPVDPPLVETLRDVYHDINKNRQC